MCIRDRLEELSAEFVNVDEFSMVDMWLAEKFFERMKINARIVLVGDPDQLPSVGAGNVFREIIETQIVPVTVLDQIFRQSKDSLIAYSLPPFIQYIINCLIFHALHRLSKFFR